MVDHRRAIVPAAYGQPSLETDQPLAYQEAVSGGAQFATRWLDGKERGPSLAQLFQDRRASLARRIVVPFEAGFLLRLEQRLCAAEKIQEDQAKAPAKPLLLPIAVEAIFHSLAQITRLVESGQIWGATPAAKRELQHLRLLSASILQNPIALTPNQSAEEGGGEC